MEPIRIMTFDIFGPWPEEGANTWPNRAGLNVKTIKRYRLDLIGFVELFWRVDWILTRDGVQRVQTTSSSIVRDAEPPLYTSDHYPVVSEVMLIG